MPSPTQPRADLIAKLLQRLADEEATLDYGAVWAPIQPHDSSMCRGGTITIAGYGWEQIDAGLKFLLREGLVHSGSVREGESVIGINFAGLTEEGRSTLTRLSPPRP
jgi:hypothetical protein